MFNLTSEDHETIFTYFKSEQTKNGYHGPCFISLERLSELHMIQSINIANNAIQSVILN